MVGVLSPTLPEVVLPVSTIAERLRAETTGGFLLLGAAVTALIWANSPWSSSYADLTAVTVGPAAWHLDLTLAEWAADGLLAIFFFVAGLELKREFVAGDLRDLRRAALPVTAAVGGMLAPAIIYTVVNAAAPGGDLRGWAVPTATDIAFALAVLAVVGSNLPAALRTFLLTLAVVDDLLAILIIAIFFTSSLHLWALAVTVLLLGVFGYLVRRGLGWSLLPLAVAAWIFMHASGVHATVAGVLLAFLVPLRRIDKLEHRWRPISAGVAVPVFAFFAAGVTVGGDLGAALTDPVTLGIVAGLILGKTIGITGATWLVQRFTRAELADELGWPDVLGVAMLGGIGFTVSLLIGDLAFGAGTTEAEHAKMGVLLGTLVAALLATVLLRLRDRHHRA
ncbi:Na+/H+ antiporter NhaA [Actinoplanes sp. NPDC000266]